MEFYTVGDYQRNWNRTISISIGIVESRWEGGQRGGIIKQWEIKEISSWKLKVN